MIKFYKHVAKLEETVNVRLTHQSFMIKCADFSQPVLHDRVINIFVCVVSLKASKNKIKFRALKIFRDK